MKLTLAAAALALPLACATVGKNFDSTRLSWFPQKREKLDPAVKLAG